MVSRVDALIYTLGGAIFGIMIGYGLHGLIN
jgi:ABC-type antimicrobial peptide transport system permease subunit